MAEYRGIERKRIINLFFENPENRRFPLSTIEEMYFYAESQAEPERFFNHLNVAVYELKRGHLTYGCGAEMWSYICLWERGELQSKCREKLNPSDIPLIQADIDFVRAEIEKRQNRLYSVFRRKTIND